MENVLIYPAYVCSRNVHLPSSACRSGTRVGMHTRSSVGGRVAGTCVPIIKTRSQRGIGDAADRNFASGCAFRAYAIAPTSRGTPKRCCIGNRYVDINPIAFIVAHMCRPARSRPLPVSVSGISRPVHVALIQSRAASGIVLAEMCQLLSHNERLTESCSRQVSSSRDK